MTTGDPLDEARSRATPAPSERRREPWPGPRPLLWAPRAHTVELVLLLPDGSTSRRPMRLVGAHEPGYWRADEQISPGTDYSFSIDGGPPLSDPAAAHVPSGIQGPSRILDERFVWRDHAWPGADLTRGSLLHLDVPTVTPEGTLDAATGLLPDVATLGVDGVELSPVAAFDPEAGPRAGVRLFAVHEPFGGPHALQRFVDTAHRHGLAVVLDLPHRWAVADPLRLDRFGPYAQGSRIAPRPRKDHGHDAPRINLDGSGSRGPRDFFVADARRWLHEFHVDGLLLDVEALADRSSAPFLTELAAVAQDVSARTGRPRALLADGPGLSDRLTTTVERLLTGRLDGPAGDLRRLSTEITAPARIPAGRRRALRAAQRSGSFVGPVTRLPAATRAVPWSRLEDVAGSAATTSADDDATLLAFAVLAGSVVVLDTEHVPVRPGSADARRLAAWTRRLLTLRPAALTDLAHRLEVTTDDGALVARRGGTALVLVLDPAVPALDLVPRLGTPSGAWRVAAAWDEERTHLEDGRLRAPRRCVVILRDDPEARPAGADPRTEP
ncbi:hypothetical protein Q6350_09940 [Isoptericola sp. b515]|uniref:hypothetical protein n=1 Tax=Isoptericola sp. b515 TaxID=3064652 RepID=UPI002712635B|nr:hypothetical protein [Isoptericola sp. b515]MDO8148750.1 hypothetical protein [Isoptericola sp. b515]